MGVDYYQCDHCSFGFRDDSDYCVWCDCGAKFCHADCGVLTNFHYEYDEGDPERGNAIIKGVPITCVLCRLEGANERGLLEALLKHLSITREQAFEIYKKQNDRK